MNTEIDTDISNKLIEVFNNNYNESIKIKNEQLINKRNQKEYIHEFKCNISKIYINIIKKNVIPKILENYINNIKNENLSPKTKYFLGNISHYNHRDIDYDYIDDIINEIRNLLPNYDNNIIESEYGKLLDNDNKYIFYKLFNIEDRIDNIRGIISGILNKIEYRTINYSYLHGVYINEKFYRFTFSYKIKDSNDIWIKYPFNHDISIYIHGVIVE